MLIPTLKINSAIQFAIVFALRMLKFNAEPNARMQMKFADVTHVAEFVEDLLARVHDDTLTDGQIVFDGGERRRGTGLQIEVNQSSKSPRSVSISQSIEFLFREESSSFPSYLPTHLSSLLSLSKPTHSMPMLQRLTNQWTFL